MTEHDKALSRVIGHMIKAYRQTFQKCSKEDSGEHYPFAALADAIGVSASTLRSWERGTVLPSLPQLFDLCSVYCIAPTDLLEDVESILQVAPWKYAKDVPANA